MTDNSSSPYTKTACLTLEAGKAYLLAASDGSKNWHFVYWKDNKKVDLDACQ